MKKTANFLAFSTLIFSLSFASCGPSKKLVASRNHVDQLQKDSSDTHTQLNECSVQVTDLRSEKATLQNQKASLQNQ